MLLDARGQMRQPIWGRGLGLVEETDNSAVEAHLGKSVQLAHEDAEQWAQHRESAIERLAAVLATVTVPGELSFEEVHAALA
jgi:hypothetical protein